MILRKTIRRVKFIFGVVRVSKMTGVNSKLGDGNHILMWDFDEVPLDLVRESLKIVRSRYFLSDIHILRTKEPHNYIAYCFSSQEWKRAVEIVVATSFVDWGFLKWGMLRGHFTLRVTPKGDRTPYVIERLEGCCLPDCAPSDLKSWTVYETMNWR